MSTYLYRVEGCFIHKLYVQPKYVPMLLEINNHYWPAKTKILIGSPIFVEDKNPLRRPQFFKQKNRVNFHCDLCVIFALFARKQAQHIHGLCVLRVFARTKIFTPRPGA